MSHDIWSIILLSGLVGWVVSALMLAFKAFPERDVFDAVSGIRWGGAAAFCFFVWIIGLLNA